MNEQKNNCMNEYNAQITFQEPRTVSLCSILQLLGIDEPDEQCYFQRSFQPKIFKQINKDFSRMIKNLARVVARGIQRPLITSARPLISIRQNRYFFASAGRQSIFEKIQSDFDHTKMDSVLSDIQALSEQDRGTALELIVAKVQRGQIPLAIILHQKILPLFQNHPIAFVNSRIFLTKALTQQLDELHKNKKMNIDKIDDIMKTIKQSFDMCQKQLQKNDQDERWRYKMIIDKKQANFCMNYLSDHLEKDEQKLANLKKCADNYRKSNKYVKILLYFFVKNVHQSKEGKFELKKQAFAMIQFYAQNILYLNRIASDINELKEDSKQLLKNNSQNIKQINEVLQLYKVVQELIPLSEYYIQLLHAKLMADYYLTYQKMVERKASEVQVDNLVKEMGVRWGQVHDEVLRRYEPVLVESKNMQKVWDLVNSLVTLKADQLEKQGVGLQHFKNALKQEQQMIIGKIADKDVRDKVTIRLSMHIKYLVTMQQWQWKINIPQNKIEIK